MLKIGAYGKSDLGLKRTNNEDAFIVNLESNLFVVADGMGGEAAGEVASQIFIDAAVKVFSTRSEESEQETLTSVQETFRLANETILKHAVKNPQHQGLGCTAELLTFSGQKYVLGHVGDSRAYLFRRGQLRQLTRDHSLVQDQIEQGLLTPMEARKHSLRHVILRAVGIDETLALDVLRGNGLPGDVFLLCSDGLTDLVEDQSIQDILLTPLSLDQKVGGLIDLAKSAGGLDNITVVLCEVM